MTAAGGGGGGQVWYPPRSCGGRTGDPCKSLALVRLACLGAGAVHPGGSTPAFPDFSNFKTLRKGLPKI